MPSDVTKLKISLEEKLDKQNELLGEVKDGLEGVCSVLFLFISIPLGLIAAALIFGGC